MKKLIVAACAVAFAACAQAASITWSEFDGLTELPECTLGGVSSDCVTMYLWTFAATAWDTKYETAANVWSAFKDGTLNASDSLAGDAEWDGSLHALTTEQGNDGDQYYAAILYVHNDGIKDDYYLANWATGKSTDLGGEVGNIGSIFGGNSALHVGDSATTWAATAVPEPTSGLLLLLGVAGLALRRRRA